jgi:hypothetical protein
LRTRAQSYSRPRPNRPTLMSTRLFELHCDELNIWRPASYRGLLSSYVVNACRKIRMPSSKYLWIADSAFADQENQLVGRGCGSVANLIQLHLAVFVGVLGPIASWMHHLRFLPSRPVTQLSARGS